MYVAAGVYALAAASLLRDIRKRNVPQLYPLLAYFGFVALSFAGFSVIPLNALATAFGAATIISLPLCMELRRPQLIALLSLLFLAPVFYGFFQGELLLIAHGTALVAVCLSALYILISGVHSSQRKISFVIGGLLFVLGIIAHLPSLLGWGSYELFWGVALMSPFSLILALYVGKHLK